MLDSPFLFSLLEEYRVFGGYPAVVFSSSREEKIDALARIVQRIFETDVLFFLEGEDILPTRQLLLFLTQNIGNRLNVESLAMHLHISSKRILKGLNFFLESFLLHEIYPYHTDKTREYSDRPKLYFHDTGLINFLRGSFVSLEHDGKITENILATELIS